MTTIAIIQARLSSTRLPGKVLLPLGDRPALAWVIHAAQAIPGIDKVVLATSDQADDDRLAAWAADHGVTCHRGPLDDVLARFALAAKAENADIIMRLTGDCPFLDPQVCGQVLALLKRQKLDYASNVTPRPGPTAWIARCSPAQPWTRPWPRPAPGRNASTSPRSCGNGATASASAASPARYRVWRANAGPWTKPATWISCKRWRRNCRPRAAPPPISRCWQCWMPIRRCAD